MVSRISNINFAWLLVSKDPQLAFPLVKIRDFAFGEWYVLHSLVVDDLVWKVLIDQHTTASVIIVCHKEAVSPLWVFEPDRPQVHLVELPNRRLLKDSKRLRLVKGCGLDVAISSTS